MIMGDITGLYTLYPRGCGRWPSTSHPWVLATWILEWMQAHPEGSAIHQRDNNLSDNNMELTPHPNRLHY